MSPMKLQPCMLVLEQKLWKAATAPDILLSLSTPTALYLIICLTSAKISTRGSKLLLQ